MGYTITNKKTGKEIKVDISTEKKEAFYDTLYSIIQKKEKSQGKQEEVKREN